MAENDERRQYLLARQKEIERELARADGEGIDRRSRLWNELEGEYTEVVDELERMDAGTWRRNNNVR